MTDTHRPIVDCILEAMPEVVVPAEMTAGLKFTSPTQTTHGGYEWPNPGEWAECSKADWIPRLCKPGGFHAATTIKAAQSGGHWYTHAMLVGWGTDEGVTDPAEPGKVKARRILTLARVDFALLARIGAFKGADLTGAYLTGANLYGADLYRADLTRADLYGANLTGADLTRADLYGANLYGADLTGAYLTGADLTGANLYGAYLTGAYLTRADLTRANLYGAYLTRADLTRANLTGAVFDKYTVWPDGFNPIGTGAKDRSNSR